MSQHALTIANQAGAAFRADVVNALQALGSLSSGASAPGTTYAYMLWADSTSGLLKQRNGANSAWVTVGTLASANFGHLSAAGDALAGALLFKSGLNNKASAATVDLTAINANTCHITGSTGINGWTMTSGQVVDVVFDGALLLTHHATTNNLPGGANITTAAGDRARYWYDGTTVWCVAYQKASGAAVVLSGAQIQPISASVGSNALTISASALSLDFRSATLTSGTVTTVAGTPANLVVSSGSTLGQTSAVAARLIVFAINNAGAIELAVGNAAGCSQYDETGLISTTAEGGAGAADSISTVYSATARTNVAYRIIGYLDNTQATAGTWATAPSTIQGAGGKALAGALTKLYQSPEQTITSAGSLTLAHGLGVVPSQVELQLKCITGEYGYSAGDLVATALGCQEYSTNRGVSVVIDATNLNVRYGSHANVFQINNKTTGAGTVITLANWRAIFIARV